MLTARVGTAVALAPIVLVAVWLGGPLFWLIGAVAAFIAAGETSRLTRRRNHDGSNDMPTQVAAAAIVVSGAVGSDAVVATVAAILIYFLLPISSRTSAGSTVNSSWTEPLGAALYASLPFTTLVLMRDWSGTGEIVSVPILGQLPLVPGVAWVAVVLSVTWVVDSIAYFAGRAFGQHLFSPLISPSKTWEGTIAGVLAGTLVGLVWAPVLDLTTAAGAMVGFVVAWAAILGDLAESSLKRHAGLKDAGTVLPGHGGLLDRVDSLAFSSVVVFLVGTVDRTTHVLRFGP